MEQTTKSHIIQRLHVTTYIWKSPKPILNFAEHNETLFHIFTKNKTLNKHFNIWGGTAHVYYESQCNNNVIKTILNSSLV